MILVKSSSNLKTDLLKEYKECPANNKPNVKINKKPNVVSLMMSGTKPNTSAKATIIKPNVPNNKNNLCDFNSIYLIYPKLLFQSVNLTGLRSNLRITRMLFFALKK